jgi:hypothetical protein
LGLQNYVFFSSYQIFLQLFLEQIC